MTELLLQDFMSAIDRDGFAILPNVLPRGECETVRSAIDEAIASAAGQRTALRSRDVIYASRDLVSVWPDARAIWCRAPITVLLRAVLGQGFGLVRALYFDKPPGHAWAVPWHQDRAIEVVDNTLASAHFTKPTRKAGVPQVEAPRELLDRMLTVRIHLDEVTDDNGPLSVVPGSHRAILNTPSVDESVVVTANGGDVLVMRPLLLHSSPSSDPSTSLHRRVVHLEFAPSVELPDGYRWYQFTGMPASLE